MNKSRDTVDKGKIIKNGLLNAIKTLCSILFPLITVPYVTRVLGAENLGKYNFANSIINYYALFASLGISTYAVRECSKVRTEGIKLNKIASELFSFNICTMFVSCIMLFITIIVYSRLEPYRLLISVLAINIPLSVIGMEWINMAMERFGYITLRTVVFQILSLLAMFLVVRSPEDYIKYAVISVCALGGANILNYFYIKRFCTISFTYRLNLKKHIKPILLVFSLLVAQSIMANLDITMLGLLVNDKAVGLYSMSVNMYVTIERVISSIAIVLLPQMAMLYQESDYEKISDLLKKVWNFIYAFSIPFVVGLIFLSKEILGCICGEEFIPAATSLSILAVAMFINLLGGSFWGNIVLLPSGREGQFMVACIVSAICNAISNYFCIPAWGINGAAVTTTISVAVVYFVCRLKKDKRIKIEISGRDIVGPLVGGTLIALVCCGVKLFVSNYWLRIFYSVIYSAVVYLIVLCCFKNEIVTMLGSRIRKRKS